MNTEDKKLLFEKIRENNQFFEKTYGYEKFVTLAISVPKEYLQEENVRFIHKEEYDKCDLLILNKLTTDENIKSYNFNTKDYAMQVGLGLFGTYVIAELENKQTNTKTFLVPAPLASLDMFLRTRIFGFNYKPKMELLLLDKIEDMSKDLKEDKNIYAMNKLEEYIKKLKEIDKYDEYMDDNSLYLDPRLFFINEKLYRETELFYENEQLYKDFEIILLVDGTNQVMNMIPDKKFDKEFLAEVEKARKETESIKKGINKPLLVHRFVNNKDDDEIIYS